MSAPSLPLYQRVLGQSWELLPPAIRQLHSVTSASSYAGRCTVARGRNPLAWVIATVLGFPKAGLDQDITVQLTVEGDGERWVRTSGGRSFSSTQHPIDKRSQRLVRERFGPVAVDMELIAGAAGLRYVVRRWTLVGVSLPVSLGPRSAASESVQDGKFRFDVEISHPLTGLIVRYRGFLTATAA